VTILVDKDVFRLKVTMDDTRCVQTLDPSNDFCSVEARADIAKAAPAIQLCPKIATRVKFLARDVSTDVLRIYIPQWTDEP
jgi:hypothetical protein